MESSKSETGQRHCSSSVGQQGAGMWQRDETLKSPMQSPSRQGGRVGQIRSSRDERWAGIHSPIARWGCRKIPGEFCQLQVSLVNFRRTSSTSGESRRVVMMAFVVTNLDPKHKPPGRMGRVKNKTQCQLCKNWVDQSFLFPGLIWSGKGFHLWMWSLGGS